MSRFERANGGSDAWTGDDHLFPDDFSTEEVEFASELRELFATEREDLPPLFTQTLLGEPRLRVPDTGFERRLVRGVLRALNLPRAPLFDRGTLLRSAMRDLFTQLSRPVAASFSALIVLMTLTVVLASPAFAAGVRLIFGHAGALQVQSYPTHVSSSGSMAHVAQRPPNAIPPMQVEWLGQSIGQYHYSELSMSSPQQWSDGPVVELRYTRSGKGGGSGLLDVREFKPAPGLAHVLQVVADNSATPVSVGGLPGVYVDGRWSYIKQYKIWQWGIKSELIFERNGLIYWIVADQRDGMGQDQLTAAALQLSPVLIRQLVAAPSLRLVGEQLVGSLQDPTDGEVIALVRAGNSSTDEQVAFVSLARSYPGEP